MSGVVIIGLDLAKSIFRSTVSMMLAGRCYAGGSVGMSWFRISPRCRLA